MTAPNAEYYRNRRRMWISLGVATAALAVTVATWPTEPDPIVVPAPAATTPGVPFDFGAYVDAITGPPPTTVPPTSWTDLMLPPEVRQP